MTSMLRKVLCLVLVFAWTTLPIAALDFGPNTIWGEVPQGVTNAANAVLQDAGGRVVATVPVIDGRFVFADVAPGQYVIVLQDGAARALATSEPVSQAGAAVSRAVFAARRVPAAVATSGGGLGTTGKILIGAATVGITTAVVIATTGNEGVASPTR